MILQNLKNYLKKLTFTRGKLEILANREVLSSPIREVTTSTKPIVDSFACPYCTSKDFFRRGFRQKRSERVQLYQCNSCGKTFTPHSVKGKHYPLTSPIKMNAVAHPFGSGRGKRIKSKIAQRNAPPGAKVGLLRPKRTGRKKK